VFVIDLILLITLVFFMLFIRCKPLIWTTIFLAVLLLASLFQLLSIWLLIPAWIIFIAAAAFTHLHTLRRHFITRPVVKVFRKVLPPVSETERAAIEAGSVWWEGELFQGRPNWRVLHNYPQPTLTAEEQAFLDNQVETVCQMLNDWDVVRKGDMPVIVWDYLKKERFFGMIIPKIYGGLGFSAYMQSCVVCKLATRSISAGVTTMVPNSLGPAELLLHYGTEEQKSYYLPRLATGEEVPCFALTSSEGGSDAGAMADTGTVCKGTFAGKEIIGVRLNFNKRYITLAPKATLVGLAFKLYDPEQLLGDKKIIGITCALLPHDHPGIEIGLRHYPMYLAFMNGPVRGKDVFIPLDWVIGGQAQLGNGWRMLMECLSAGRGISLPALSTAAGKRNYAITGAYAKIREQFNLSIGKFEGVQETLAKLAGYAYMLESCRTMTAGAVDLVGKPALSSAIAKYHMTEMLRKISDITMDIHAGRGIQAGPRNYLTSMYLSIPIAITVEGANILTRSLMIFGQGAIRCHPYVYEEMQALLDTDFERGLKRFDQLLIGHMGYGMSNFVRALSFGITNAKLIRSPKAGPTSYFYQQLTRMSTALSLIAGLSMLLLGGDLKRRESISARLGDVLSYLYIGSSVLKYYVDNGSKSEEFFYVNWCLKTLLYEIQEAFYGVFDNFPNPIKGKFFRIFIFPWGRCYRKPSDKLGHKLAEHMMTNSELRQRYNKLIWYSTDKNDPTGRVEVAFLKMLEIESPLKKIQKAIQEKLIPKKTNKEARLAAAIKANIITENEAQAIREFEILRADALQVDDFKPEFFEKLN